MERKRVRQGPRYGIYILPEGRKQIMSAMIDANLAQNELAKELGISNKALSTWILGRFSIPEYLCRPLYEALKNSAHVQFLLDFEEGKGDGYEGLYFHIYDPHSRVRKVRIRTKDTIGGTGLEAIVGTMKEIRGELVEAEKNLLRPLYARIIKTYCRSQKREEMIEKLEQTVREYEGTQQ